MIQKYTQVLMAYAHVRCIILIIIEHQCIGQSVVHIH